MDRGPNALARTLDMAIQSKRDQEENSTNAFAYGDGTTIKQFSPQMDGRFAGDRLIGGINGTFGAVTNNKENKEAQDKLATWAGQWASGPFGLGVAGGDAPPEGVA